VLPASFPTHFLSPFSSVCHLLTHFSQRRDRERANIPLDGAALRADARRASDRSRGPQERRPAELRRPRRGGSPRVLRRPFGAPPCRPAGLPTAVPLAWDDPPLPSRLPPPGAAPATFTDYVPPNAPLASLNIRQSLENPVILQTFLQQNRLGGPAAEAGAAGIFDAEALFEPYAHRWIAASLSALREKCWDLERDGAAGGQAAVADPLALQQHQQQGDLQAEQGSGIRCARLVREMLSGLEVLLSCSHALLAFMPTRLAHIIHLLQASNRL